MLKSLLDSLVTSTALEEREVEEKRRGFCSCCGGEIPGQRTEKGKDTDLPRIII